MFRARATNVWVSVIALSALFFAPVARAATACVWKLTRPDGKTVYFGGSVHALQKNDYPLPAAYMRAFNASSRMALEVDATALRESSENLVKNGKYPKGDSLKNHVDPRTYAYMVRLFSLLNVSETSFAQFRPWFIVLLLQDAARRRLLPENGVDDFLMKKARERHMPMVGLESALEHERVFSGLSDREAEIFLLVTFIPSGGAKGSDLMKAWRRGDAEALARMMQQDSQEYPAFNARLLDSRNRTWIPKIEQYLESEQTYFVVVGAGHFGGNNGLLALLRAKGYQIEQF